MVRPPAPPKKGFPKRATAAVVAAALVALATGVSEIVTTINTVVAAVKR